MAVLPSRLLGWVSTVGLAFILGAGGPAFADPAGSGPASAPAAGVAGPATLSAAAEQAGQDAAASLQPATAPAPSPERANIPLSGGVTVDLMSHYVWRGFLLTDGLSFQPAVWGKVGDVTVTSWMTWAADQDGGPLMEHDLTVDYTKAVGNATLSVGYINYLFPAVDQGSVSNEVYVASAFATVLNPTVKVYFDVHEGKGTYLNFGVSHPIPLGDRGITALPSFAIGYNHKQWIDESAWNDANFGFKVNVPINSHLTLGPGIYYSKGLNDAIPDQFYGGVSIVTTF